MLKRTLLYISLLFSCNTYSYRNPFILSNALTPHGTMHLHYIKLHYTAGKNILQSIQAMKHELLSPSAKISFSSYNRTLIIYEHDKNMKRVISLIRHIDTPTPQVFIKASIINIDKDYLTKIGVDFTQNSKARNHSNSFWISSLSSHHNIKVDFLEHSGHAHVIADPLLFTLDNQSSSIESGSEIPYQQSTKSGGTSIAFKKAVLRLKITPSVLPDHRILLKIRVNQDSVSNLTVNGEPAIKTQNMSTEVITKNQHTVILGGILNTTNTTYINGIPIIQHIPLLGSLFQNRHTIHHNQELLLLITPSIKYAY